MSNKPKVAVYCRVSSKGQKDNTSLDSQQEMGVKFCEDNNYKPIPLRDASTGANMDREMFQQMWMMMETKEVIGVWFWKVDRLLRDMGVFNSFVLHAKKTECRIWFAGTEVRINEVADFARMAYESVGATVERLSIRERSEKAMLRKFDEGTLFIGQAPMGFERDRKKGKGGIFPVEKDLDIVREVFRVFLLDSVQTYSDVIKHMKRHHEHLINRISLTNVKRWLSNTIYIGEAVNNTKHGTMVYHVEPIFEYSYWEKVQQKRSRIGRTRGKRTNVYQLENKVKCGTCGRDMWVMAQVHTRKNGDKYRVGYYTCKRKNPKARDTRFEHYEYENSCPSLNYNKISVSKLEHNIWEVLFNHVLPKADEIKSEFKKRANVGVEKKNSFKGKLKHYEKEITKKQQALDELTILLAQKTIDKVQYKRTSDALKVQIAEITNKLTEVREEYDRFENLPKVDDWLADMKNDLSAKYDIKREVDRKRILQKYVNEVHIVLNEDKGRTSKSYKILLTLNLTISQTNITIKDKQTNYDIDMEESNKPKSLTHNFWFLVHYLLVIQIDVIHCKSTTYTKPSFRFDLSTF